jgi:hypothetical protein
MHTACARRPAGRARAQGAAGPAAGHAEARRAPCAPPPRSRSRSGRTHPFTPLTYNDGALMPQVWTAASASTT